MTLTTTNPATNTSLKTYNLMSKEEVFAQLDKAHTAFTQWKSMSVQQRAPYFTRLAQVLKENKEAYAKLITQEMGKPITQARAEVEKCAWLCEVYVQEGPEWIKEKEIEADGKKHLIVYDPLGVVLFIMPWNFPFWQAFRIGVPTLMAGNTALLKHSSVTPGCSLAIADAFSKAGFPAHCFSSVITGHEVINDLIAHDHLVGVALTGSVRAGQRIAAQAGAHLKPVVLELGGSDPFIVLDDADIDRAATQAAKGRLLNAGQICISPKRFIVDETVAQVFTQKLHEELAKVIVGDPLNETTTMGPLVNQKAAKEMQEFVADAREKGAAVHTFGDKHEGAFFAPTLVTDTTKEMRVTCEEVFGPVATVITVKSEQEAIAVANNSEFGLGASVWTQNLERGERVVRQIDAGSCFVNQLPKSDPRVPVGGIKKSGIGRELREHGMKAFTNVKTINIYK